MREKPEDKNLPSEDKLLRALAKELKNPLILIARQAELEKSGRGARRALESIQKTAENTLELLDSYLLAARSEYGQTPLPMETVSVGSVIYEVAKDIAPFAKAAKVDFALELKDSQVSANREGLKAAIRCLAETIIAQQIEKSGRQKVRIRTDRQKDIISVSVLGSGVEVTNHDIEMARRTLDRAHLAGGKLFDSGVRLAIADILAGALGAGLQVRRVGGLRGLNFELPRNTQLSLV